MIDAQDSELAMIIRNNPSTYLIVGDVDKPFHRPECECQDCEQWRTDRGRPTHKELRCQKA